MRENGIINDYTYYNPAIGMYLTDYKKAHISELFLININSVKVKLYNSVKELEIDRDVDIRPHQIIK